MKRISLIVFAFTFSIAWAQDTLYFTNGEKIACEVGIFDDFSVDYTPWKKTSPTYTVKTNLLDSMVFNTGEKTNFIARRTPLSKVNIALADTANSDKVQRQSFEQGFSEGFNTRFPKQGTASFFGGFCCGVVGVGLPIYYNLNSNNSIPLKNSLGNTAYDNGVRRGARKRMARTVWGNYALGIGTLWATYYGLLLAAAL